MGILGRRRRLERLEAQVEAKNSEWVIPVACRVLLKTIARQEAREAGEELPPYGPEELAELRCQDIEIVEGCRRLGALRESPGWQSPEGQAMLEGWVEDAQRRLARAEELGEEWRLAYEEDDENDQEEYELC